MAREMDAGSHFSSKKEEEPAIDIVHDNHKGIVSGGSTSQILTLSGADQATSSVSPQEAAHHGGVGGGGGDFEAVHKDCGRERLKRHREEVAGRVTIPDTWGQENFLEEWIDSSTFDKLLAPKEISSAREALVAEERRKSSPRLSIASRC